MKLRVVQCSLSDSLATCFPHVLDRKDHFTKCFRLNGRVFFLKEETIRPKTTYSQQFESIFLDLQFCQSENRIHRTQKLES